MPALFRNILVVIAAIILGSVLNGFLIAISSSVIPPPEGADLTTLEGLKAAMAQMGPKHFIMPFLAHAMGTLLGAFIAARFSVSHHSRFAYIIGVAFLIGGTINVIMLPSPLWFTLLDLLGAYLPMAWFGIQLAGRK